MCVDMCATYICAGMCADMCADMRADLCPEVHRSWCRRVCGMEYSRRMCINMCPNILRGGRLYVVMPCIAVTYPVMAYIVTAYGLHRYGLCGPHR